MTEQITRRHPLLEGVMMGTGAWAWGDRLLWGYGHGYGDEDVKEAFQASLAAGIRFFDTAEGYGQGKSEELLGKFAAEFGEPVRIATKFMPYPWRLRRGALTRALRASLKRLGVVKVDLYQIHQPMPPLTPEFWMEAMAEAYHSGLTEAVGVSNYDRRWMQRAYDTLIRAGIPLASNQMEYSLINRRVEKSGLLKHCQELGVTLIAYSPLGMGMLTGKYSTENPPVGIRSGRYSRRYLAQIHPLIILLKKIGADHAGRTAGQVALNWVMRKGALPIPGAKNVEQAEQNAGALGWQLSEDEVGMLDEMSDRVMKTG